MKKEIEQYITKRYERWVDYAKYHCSQAGIPDDALDVMHEVMLSLLGKDENFLMKLYNIKKGQYRELDFFILRMIKLNATSNTSPYRFRFKNAPIDSNVDYSILEIIDESDDEFDIAGNILNQMNKVRELIQTLNIDKHAIEIFEFKFFNDGNFKEWTGPESMKELYEIYGKTKKLITLKLNGKILL